MRNFYRFHRVLPVAVFPLAGIVSKWKDEVHAKEAPFEKFHYEAARFLGRNAYAAYHMQVGFNVKGITIDHTD